MGKVKILYRRGSQCIIQANDGTYWLTRRKKRRHDSRRKVPDVTKKPSVFFFPIRQLTCEEVEILMGDANHRCENGGWPEIRLAKMESLVNRLAEYDLRKTL